MCYEIQSNQASLSTHSVLLLRVWVDPHSHRQRPKAALVGELRGSLHERRWVTPSAGQTDLLQMVCVCVYGFACMYSNVCTYVCMCACMQWLVKHVCSTHTSHISISHTSVLTCITPHQFSSLALASSGLKPSTISQGGASAISPSLLAPSSFTCACA